MRLKTSKGEKVTYSLICVFGLDSLMYAIVSAYIQT